MKTSFCTLHLDLTEMCYNIERGVALVIRDFENKTENKTPLWANQVAVYQAQEVTEVKVLYNQLIAVVWSVCPVARKCSAVESSGERVPGGDQRGACWHVPVTGAQAWDLTRKEKHDLHRSLAPEVQGLRFPEIEFGKWPS